MNNIPVFDTQNGVGSLILKDIPYTQTAYIKIESASYPDEFLHECVSFCKMAGAEKIFAAGYSGAEKFPLSTQILRMECNKNAILQTEAHLVGVTEQSLGEWLQIYREKMRCVDNAAYMTDKDGRQMLDRNDGFFVYEQGTLLGIGMAAGTTIDLVASLQPNAGWKIVSVLTRQLQGEMIQLDVASTNRKAIELYERIGFNVTRKLSEWYKIVDVSRKIT